MGDARTAGPTSYDDYLAIERATDQRHEWLDGRDAGCPRDRSGLRGHRAPGRAAAGARVAV